MTILSRFCFIILKMTLHILWYTVKWFSQYLPCLCRMVFEIRKRQKLNPSQSSFQHSKKALATTLLILSIFILCWLPQCLFQVILLRPWSLKATNIIRLWYMSKITRTQNLGVSRWRSTSSATVGPESCLGVKSLTHTLPCPMVASFELRNRDIQDFSACVMSDADADFRVHFGWKIFCILFCILRYCLSVLALVHRKKGLVWYHDPFGMVATITPSSH